MILLIFGAICLGFSAIFVKAMGNELGPTTIAFWRMFFGGLLFFSINALRRKTPVLPIKTIPWALLAGLFFSLDISVWHRSIILTGAGIATILGNTQVFHTAILSRFIFKDRPSVMFYAATFTAMIGVALLSGFGSRIEFGDKYILGIIFGLLAGLCYAFYVIVLRKVSTRIKPDPMTFIGWICIFASVFLGIGSAFESSPFFPAGLKTLSLLLGLTLVVQVLGWWTIFTALSKIEASRVGLVLLIQPTLSTILGFLIFDERLMILQILGGAITLASIYYGVKYRKRALSHNSSTGFDIQR